MCRSRVLSFLFACLFLLFSGGAEAASDIRIAFQPSPLYAPLFVARAKGWVEEELASARVDGRVVWASFAAGPAMNESFAAGQQDIGFMGDAPALIGKAVGIETRVAGISVRGPKGLGVIVSKGSAILSPNQLKGKKVAVTKGSYAQRFLALVLEREGLAWGDVELVNMPPPEIPAAIISGAIDAGAVWEPFISRFESENEVRVLTDAEGLMQGAQPIVVASDFLARHRDAVAAVLRAFARGSDFILSNPQDAAALASKEANLPAPLLVKVFAKQSFGPRMEASDVAELEKAERYMRKTGLLRSAVDVRAWIDRSAAGAQK